MGVGSQQTEITSHPVIPKLQGRIYLPLLAIHQIVVTTTWSLRDLAFDQLHLIVLPHRCSPLLLTDTLNGVNLS